MRENEANLDSKKAEKKNDFNELADWNETGEKKLEDHF